MMARGSMPSGGTPPDSRHRLSESESDTDDARGIAARASGPPVGAKVI